MLAAGLVPALCRIVGRVATRQWVGCRVSLVNCGVWGGRGRSICGNGAGVVVPPHHFARAQNGRTREWESRPGRDSAIGLAGKRRNRRVTIQPALLPHGII